MGDGKAFLIGVPRYVNKVPSLDPVINDINNLRSALETRGVDVKSVDIDNIASTTRSSILAFLSKELQKLRNVDTLLIYFSGHGLHFKGKDYIVPSDCVVEDINLFEETLLSIEKILSILYQANARTIIFLVDACREGIDIIPENDGKLISPSLGRWGNTDIEKSQVRKVTVVYSCQLGELSRFQSGKDGFSFFTRALCNTIQAIKNDTSIRELLDETQKRLDDLLIKYDKKGQKLFYLAQTSLAGDEDILRRSFPLRGEISNQQLSNKPWHKAVFESTLWTNAFKEDNISLQVKNHIDNILNACWLQWKISSDVMPNDPWRDYKYPIRCIKILEALLSDLDENNKLTIFEVSTLLLAPFIREAVYSKGIELISNENPFSLDDTGATSNLRGSYEKYCRSIPHLVGFAKNLENKSNIIDRNAITYWIIHKALIREPLLWVSQKDGGYFSGFAYDAIYVSTEKTSVLNDIFRPFRLIEFSKVITSDTDRILRDDVLFVMETKRILHLDNAETSFRDRLVAWMLLLASYMAIDVRLLPNMIISHVGLSDAIIPADIINSLNSSKWNTLGTGKSLGFDCKHPALEFVIQEHLDSVSEVLQRINNRISERKDGLEILTNVPDKISGSSIRPTVTNGIPAYQKPFTQFHLANERVKELLMGDNLYGEPELAIRELYQNSLDAIRYKKLRNDYLRINNEWSGTVKFIQGVDSEGKEYIECYDNGVGMGLREIEGCFSKAGVRFHDLPEFIEEQSEWIAADSRFRLYPNSQFGIGVFSYFMIADNINIETCRMGRDGKNGKILKINIPSSSSLFRIQEIGVGTESFTKIRLYLSDKATSKELSCIKTLTKLLEAISKMVDWCSNPIWE